MSEHDNMGPRLTDAELFAKIDLERPGLEGISEAIEAEDWAEARRIFAAEARESLQPERLLSIGRTFEGHGFMYEDETVAQAAERIARGELISCGTPHQFEDEVDWFINPTFNQYREWTWQLSRHPEWALLGQRYRETGDERYAEAFVRYFESWVHQALVPEDAPGGDTLCWRTIEAGIRMGGSWQWALHAFYQSPHFTDDVLIDWYKSVWEHGWRLRNFHRTGNWLIMEMNGLAQIGILYPQFVDAAQWKAYAFEVLVEELDAQVYPDGFQVELSTGYHQVDIRNYGWLMDVCRAYEEPVPEAFHTGLERMHAVNVRMMMPDGRLPDVNDGGWHHVAPLMERAVEAYPERQDFAWAHTAGVEGTPPDETSVAFPYAGYYIMRTSWSPDAVWALFDGGPYGYGHQHEDKLNLLLHAYGHLLLTEGGNYAYDGSEMRRYVLSTRAHNTIRIDGQDQNRRLDYDRQAFDVTERAGAAWRTTDTYDLADATYDEDYGPEAAQKVTHQRTVLMIKEPPGGLGPFLLAIDRLTPEDDAAHTAQILWHLAIFRATVDGVTVHSQADETANLSILPAATEGLSVELVAGQETPEWQGWVATRQHQQGQYAPTPTACYELPFSAPVRLVTLLYPVPPGEVCPVRAVEASSGIDATAIRLVLADGSTIELSEEDDS
jgi:hypothetical protein